MRSVADEDLTIRLQDPRQLFEALPVDPMTDDYTAFTAQPALVTLHDRMLRQKSRPNVQATLTVVLPDHQIRPDLAEDLTEAVHRWAKVRSELDERALQVEVQMGKRQALVHVVLFLLLQATAIVLRQSFAQLDEPFLESIAEGVSIASWVLLWFPIDVVLGGIWGARSSRAASRALANMSVKIVAASELAFPSSVPRPE